MKGALPTKVLFFFLTALLIGGWALFMIQKSYADSLDVLHAALPNQIKGWIAEPDDRFFDDETTHGSAHEITVQTCPTDGRRV